MKEVQDVNKIPHEKEDWGFWACLIASVSLGLWGFVTPPMGVIDGSVLILVGFMFAFAALRLGYKSILNGRHTTITHKDTTIDISAHHED